MIMLNTIYIDNGSHWEEIIPTEIRHEICGDRRQMVYIEGYYVPFSRKNSPFTFNNQRDIKNVIFAPPATIVYWNDGTKTVVKCQEGDEFSKEIGLAMAICKKHYGNKGNYNKVFDKWIGE